MPRESENASPVGPTTPPLEQVLPVLLLGDHLTADSKLACFGLNKGMADQVLRVAPCTKLMLNLGGAAAAGGKGSSGRGRGGKSSSSRSARGGAAAAGGSSSSSRIAAVEAAQQLAARSSNVALALHDGLLTPAACLWQRITSIHLQGVKLSPKDLSSRSQLQLHNLPHLHTLSLEACDLTDGPVSRKSPAAASSIRTLKCMRCTPDHPTLLPMVLSLVDPAQLQTLITDNNAATDILAQLPALQEVQLSGLACMWDDALRQLLQAPDLTRVTLPAFELAEDHSNQPCNWDSLTLTRGVDVLTLTRLPLARIQSCIVQGSVECWFLPEDLDRAINHLNRCPGLVFQPTKAECRWSPAEPSFGITYKEEADRYLHLVMQQWSGGAMVMLAGRTKSELTPVVVAALAAAPPTITTMGFMVGPHDDWEAVGEVEAGVISHLPAHISHVVFLLGGELSIEHWRGVLGWFLKSVTRPLKLTLLNNNQWLVWTPDVKQAVQEWLSARAGNQVQVAFQSVQQ